MVPQLWQCSPSIGPGQCAPGDWSLAAANGAGDALLSQLGDGTNGAVTLLLTTPHWLYVGFDNASTGIQVYRASTAPKSTGDFSGKNGCIAGTPGCQGLGGNGFGDPTVTHIFDAKALTFGGATAVWLAVGDGSGPVKIYSLESPGDTQNPSASAASGSKAGSAGLASGSGGCSTGGGGLGWLLLGLGVLRRRSPRV